MAFYRHSTDRFFGCHQVKGQVLLAGPLSGGMFSYDVERCSRNQLKTTVQQTTDFYIFQGKYTVAKYTVGKKIKNYFVFVKKKKNNNMPKTFAWHSTCTCQYKFNT